MKHLDDLKFPRLVLLVLLNSFDRNFDPSGLDSSAVNLTKSATSNLLFHLQIFKPNLAGKVVLGCVVALHGKTFEVMDLNRILSDPFNPLRRTYFKHFHFTHLLHGLLRDLLGLTVSVVIYCRL